MVLPNDMKEVLCKTLEHSDSPTNSCQNGSTIEYNKHFITNNDDLLLFVYLDEHLGTAPIYPASKIPLLIDNKGNWSYYNHKTNGTIPQQTWAKISKNYSKDINNNKAKNWKVIQKKESIEFTHKKTKQVIKISKSQKSSEVFYLQVGAYKSSTYRRSIQRKLARLPYPPHLEIRKVGHIKYTKLLIGPFSNLEKVTFVKKMLPKKHSNAFIFKERSKG